MLYERWQRLARDFRHEIALTDLASGEHWTFSELANAAESQTASEEPVVFPEGASPDFILTVLRGWKRTQIVCPIESGKPRPTLDSLPAGCAHLKFTSASAGPARLIAFTAEQLAADAENIVETMKLRRNEPNLAVISLAHSYGFSNLVLPLLLHGIPLILGGSSLPETVRRAQKKFDALTLPGVPALWRAWLDANVLTRKIRLAISAGAPLSIALEKAVYEKAGIKIHNFYGASECGGIAYDQTEKPRKDPQFVGQLMKGVAVSIDAENCLVVRGSAVGQSYFPNESERLRDGCFRTSDMAEVRQDKIFLSGRASDQINVAGRKISPEFIETALLAHPEVADSLVFGIPSADEERGETIVACVAVNGRLTAETLRQFLLTSLPAWKVPREWWILDSLQTNQRGKRSRSEWRENYLKSRSAGEAQSPARSS